jgi:cbb3-type cytochrome oxidase subunit 3
MTVYLVITLLMLGFLAALIAHQISKKRKAEAARAEKNRNK